MRRSWMAVTLVLAGTAWGQNAAEYNDLGIAAYGAGRWAEAIRYFEQAYELAPEHLTVRRNLCNAHQAAADSLAKQADYAAAAKHLELAINIDPENASPLVQLGAYYLRLDMVKDAIFRLEEAIELQPGLLDAHELLGEAYYRDNDIPSARSQWEYVLEVDPGRTELRKKYEKAFREEGIENQFRKSGSSHFNLSFPDQVPHALRGRVLNLLERAYNDVGRKFGGVYPPDPVNVIVYSAEQFSQATLMASHVGALFDGKIRVPLTDETGSYLSEEELRRRLYHEYVHVIVRFVAGANAPWWLNEGLAEAFSREIEAPMQEALRRAYAEKVAFSTRNLEGSQLQKLSPDVLRLAYIQSHATVELLWRRYGARRLTQLMNELATGTPPEEALRRAYRRDYATLDAEVAEQYLGR